MSNDVSFTALSDSILPCKDRLSKIAFSKKKFSCLYLRVIPNEILKQL